MATDHREQSESVRLQKLTEQARQLCELWQGRLYLKDWTVAIAIRRSKDFPAGYHDSLGCCVHNPYTGEAEIYILDPLDFSKELIEYDVEATIVHELLHLHWAGHPLQWNEEEEELANMMHERAIDRTARALIRAYGHYGR